MYEWENCLLSREEFLLKISHLIANETLVAKNSMKEDAKRTVYYYNLPSAFDIEVTSFYEGGIKKEHKRAIMYIWQFGILEWVTTGRTWTEFMAFLDILKKIMGLDNEHRLIIYVHNLPYEFQFIRKRLQWEEVFILSDRKPVYANSFGLEFRCSLKLAGGKSLENVGKDLVKYKAKKAVGQLDYSILRTPLTPLSREEMEYCVGDVLVLLCYIREKIEQDGDISKIPLTNTGYVRNFCRKKCFKRWKRYRQLMENLTIEPSEYSQLKAGFQGGFTHANAHFSRRLLKNVGSHDFGSSYPAVMLLEKFPMSKGVLVDSTIPDIELEKLFLTKCCLFTLELWDVFPTRYQEHPLSKSKCSKDSICVVDNGRVVFADYLRTVVTEQDYFIYLNFYNWSKIRISNLWVYEKQYLPTPFVEAILELYKKKTILKDVVGEEVNYMISKNMINSAYGMSVTNPVRSGQKYGNDMFIPVSANIEKSIDKYNNDVRRFLFYPWGIWVTAYARANLFSGIIALDDDYVYADTDSVKSLHTNMHTEYFDKYNAEIMRKIEASAKYHNIPIEDFMPKTAKGVVKPIGLWENEGVYANFKTLGAKRYLVKKSGKDGDIYQLTVAGAHKKKAMRYLIETGDPFGNFTDKLKIPEDYSGRLIMTYIDNETEGVLVDYNGVPYHYHELSSVHMEPSEYNLSLSQEYLDYLEGYIDFSE